MALFLQAQSQPLASIYVVSQTKLKSLSGQQAAAESFLKSTPGSLKILRSGLRLIG